MNEAMSAQRAVQGDGHGRTRLNRAMRRLNTELTSSNRAVAGVTGLNESDLAVLDILHQDGPAAPSLLARRTRIPPATMTNVLARLERNGWVERRPVEGDRRSIRIHPTSTTRLAGLFSPANTRLTGLLDSFPPEHATSILRFLEGAVDIIRDEAAQITSTEKSPATVKEEQ